MPTALVVQHLEPEGPVLIGEALHAAGVEVVVVRPDRGEPVPASVDGLDGLVVMGGPMSARGDDGFPSRRAELALLGAAVEAEVPTLGVCLGAQLLAVAGGGEVEAGPELEVGWGTVVLSDAAAGDPLLAGIGPEVPVLHWHGETFTLPAGAVLLASSARYPHQAFRLGPAAWGLQFHLEVDAAAVARFVAAFGAEADDPEQILEDADAWLARSADAQRTVLARFADLVAP
ncbi:MAG TPA: type 1 glutamine amidotransferase [Iamia sp.]|nr:type 1 glutamine amidotransferase [Iamia sp.]